MSWAIPVGRLFTGHSIALPKLSIGCARKFLRAAYRELSGVHGGFNRWMQQIGQIVQLVFHSLVFFLDDRLIVLPIH